MIALLPCPFCGGEAGVARRRSGQSYVLCHGCLAESDWFMEENDAIAAWNRRAPSADARAAEAAMREKAAAVADAFPARTHGALATAPYAAAEQAAEEIATAIRALPLSGDGGRDGVA